MSSQDKYLESACKSAQAYVKRKAGECDRLMSEAKEADKFYSQTSRKRIFGNALLIIIGIFITIVALSFLLMFCNSLERNPDGNEIKGQIFWCLGLFGGGGIGIVACNIWKIYCYCCAKRTRNTLKTLMKLKESFLSAAQSIQENCLKVKECIFTEAGVNEEFNSNTAEDELALCVAAVETTATVTTKKKSKVLLILFPICLLLHYIMLGYSAVSALAAAYGYYSMLMIFINYFILYCFLYEIKRTLVKCYGNRATTVTMIMFLVYQVLFGIAAFAEGLVEFDFLINIMKSVSVDAASFQKNVVGCMLLIITTVLGIMLIVKTDTIFESKIKKEGFVIPMSEAENIKMTAKEIRRHNGWLYIAASAYVVWASTWAAEMYNDDFSFGSIITYIFLCACSTGVMALFETKRRKALFEGRIPWVRNAFLCAYLMMILSMTNGISLGICLLTLGQPIIGIVVFLIVGMFL